MSQYLLDTNICIYFLKGKFDLDRKLEEIGLDNCAISEITLAELKYGAEKSQQKENNRQVVEAFMSSLTVIPIFNSLDVYAKEKARLRSAGTIVDDFDLLIGATAIANKMVMVTRNERHFSRLESIVIENWIDSDK